MTPKFKYQFKPEQRFKVNTKQIKRIPEIFKFIGKTLLNLETEKYENLVLTFHKKSAKGDKDIAVTYQQALGQDQDKQSAISKKSEQLEPNQICY